MKNLYDNVSARISKNVTNQYSTSFSLGIRLLKPSIRPAIYAIYGFVACVVLVVLAKIMRKGLMRDEHYYDARVDEQDTPTLNDSPQATATKEAQS